MYLNSVDSAITIYTVNCVSVVRAG